MDCRRLRSRIHDESMLEIVVIVEAIVLQICESELVMADTFMILVGGIVMVVMRE